jgi:flavodoxin
MNVLVVYFSKFGHTRKIAEEIARSLQRQGSARAIPADQLQPADFAGLDLLVFGTPTHRMNLPEALRPILEALPRRCLRGVNFAAFDTSYKMSAWLQPFTAAKKLSRKLRKLGGKRLVPPETFHVVEREGPLYDGELERAREWVQALLKQSHPYQTDVVQLNVK